MRTHLEFKNPKDRADFARGLLRLRAARHEMRRSRYQTAKKPFWAKRYVIDGRTGLLERVEDILVW